MAYFAPGPNFGNTNYPNGGDRLGKAWAGMWHQLSKGGWHSVASLHEAALDAAHCEKKTVYNLAQQAQRYGLLGKRLVTRNGRTYVEYCKLGM